MSFNLLFTADVKQRKQNILNNEPNPDNSPSNKENEQIILQRDDPFRVHLSKVVGLGRSQWGHFYARLRPVGLNFWNWTDKKWINTNDKLSSEAKKNNNNKNRIPQQRFVFWTTTLGTKIYKNILFWLFTLLWGTFQFAVSPELKPHLKHTWFGLFPSAMAFSKQHGKKLITQSHHCL